MFRAVRNLPRVAVPALVVALAAASGSAAAGTRSHLHHPSVAPMPASSFVETSSPRVGKKHKGGSHTGSVRANSRPSSATGAVGGKGKSGRAGKGRGGRAKHPDTDAQPIMMYRTSHPAGGHGVRNERAEALSHSGRNPDGSRYQPILVDGRGRPVSRARFAAMRAGAPAVHWTSSATSALRGDPAGVSHRGLPRNYTLSVSDGLYATHSDASGPAAFADAHANAFATGIAHPPGDEQLPRATAAGSGTTISGAHIGSAIVMTPGTQPPAPAATSPVVQGFGSEVALAPTDSVRTPGITRRRDHPIPASALPGMAPVANSAPQTLEDRDAITLAAVSPAVLPDIYDRDGRLLMPAPLKGSHEVLIHQNTMAANDGLERIRDDYDLDRLRAEHALIAFPVSNSLRVNDDLPSNRRCARPWTVLFAADISRDFFERFHQPMTVTSAVRTVSYQARLQRVNGNAAATDGDAASPHLTGQAIDLGKRGMSSAELAWMRAYLMPLISSGKIDVEEEFQQACFHISVYRRYAGGRLPAHEFAQVRPAGAPTPDVLVGTDPQTNR